MAHRSAPYNGKRFNPTEEQRRQVLTMTGFGIRQDEIAISLQIDKKTLHKHFRRELDTGMIEANVRVAKALYQNATQHNNVAAQIWWTKTRMGWKDTSGAQDASGALLVDFRWADAPPAQPQPAVTDAAPATIEVEAAEVVWSDGNDINEC